MLLAYIDEIGEPGAFVSRDDRRFNTSPAFGYAGFIIPEDYARQFGATFVKEKRIRFAEKMREKGPWTVGSERVRVFYKEGYS